MCAANKIWAGLGLLMLAAGCATPVAPTGGQPVRTPPSVVEASPTPGSVRFGGREVSVSFDRFMNRSTAVRAVRVEPDLGIPFQISWRRKQMRISFARPFPDSTTVIVTLGPELADVDGNKLGTAFPLAFSTGAQIDSAGVDVQVLSLVTGGGDPNRTVALFRAGQGLDGPAVYMAETDTAGLARFRYVAEGGYRPVLVDDRNRNRTIEPNEAHFPGDSLITVGTDSIRLAARFVWSLPDTTAPRVSGVGLLSSSRLRLRFTEPVLIDRNSTIGLMPEAGPVVPAMWLYTETNDPSIAYAQSEASLQEGIQYRVQLSGVTDRAGNAVLPYDLTVTGSSAADTTRQRLVREPFVDAVLSTDTLIAVYSRPLDQVVLDSLHLVDGETLIRGWDDVMALGNRVQIFRTGGWLAGQAYQVRLWDPAQQRHAQLSFRPLDTEELGGLEIVPDSSWFGKRIVVEIADPQGQTLRRSVTEGPVEFQGLVPGEVVVRAWVDENGNGRWDGGSLLPQPTAREPVYVRRGVPVTPRMTSVVSLGRF